MPEGRKGDIGIFEIKFWNDEVLKNIDNVLETIYVEIEHLSPPQPSAAPPINGWSQKDR